MLLIKRYEFNFSTETQPSLPTVIVSDDFEYDLQHDIDN